MNALSSSHRAQPHGVLRRGVHVYGVPHLGTLLLGLSLFAGAALLPAPARAADPPAPAAVPDPADPAAEARRLIEEAAKAYEAGDKPRAEQAYEGAFAIRKTFDTATNLGIVELELGKAREAAEHLDFAFRNFPPAEKQENKDRLIKLLAQAKSQVASLRITVDVPGATVSLNGTEIGQTPLEAEAFAEPGQQRLLIKKPGYADESRDLSVGAGLSETVTIQMRAAETPAADKPVWPYIVFGVAGAAGLGLGITGIVVSSGAKSDADDLDATLSDGACLTDSPACQDLQASLDDANTFQGVGIAGFALAGAAGLGAIIYALVPAGSQPDAEDTASTFSLSPLLGPTNGFLLQGRF